jgi:plastocyanin
MTPTPRWTSLYAFFIFGLLSVSAQAKTIQVNVENLAFTPAEVSAELGDTVEWINKDMFAHSATASNGDWDVNLPPHQTGRMVLKKPGEIDYFCKFHPNMKGRVMVKP